MVDLFYHRTDQTISDRWCSPRDYWDHYLRHLDLHLGLDECHQIEPEEHHDDLDTFTDHLRNPECRIRRGYDPLHGNAPDKQSLTITVVIALAK